VRQQIRGRRLDAVSVRVVPAPDDVPRLKRSEQENARLKKLVAERDLEIEVMREIAARKMVGMLARREQVAYARRRGLSQ
jgi:putative transposase